MSDASTDLDEILNEKRVRHGWIATIGPYFNILLLAAVGAAAWLVWRQEADETRRQQVALELSAHRVAQDSETRALQLNEKLRDMRRDFEEIRALVRSGAKELNSEQARQSAFEYLRGNRRLTVADIGGLQPYRLQEGAPIDGSPPFTRLVEGVLSLHEFETRDFPTLEPEKQRQLFTLLQRGAEEADTRPEPSLANLVAARSMFRSLRRDDEALRPLARAGWARIQFIVAEAANFVPAACARLIRGRASLEEMPPQYLLSRAECLRKVGRTREALQAFSLALRQINETPEQRRTPEWANLAYRAEHGFATTSIPLIADGDTQGLDAAEEGLRRAAELRGEAGQTLIEKTYSLENIGFIHLRRRGGLDAAIRHAQDMDATTPFLTWSLTIWALASEEMQRGASSRVVRHRLTLFRRSEFNECELRLLLPQRYAPRLEGILNAAQPDIPPQGCRPDTSADVVTAGP